MRKKIISFSIILSFVVALIIFSKPVGAIDDDNTVSNIVENEISLDGKTYSLENLELFNIFLNERGFDLYKMTEELLDSYGDLYNEALNSHVISYVNNDFLILLGRYFNVEMAQKYIGIAPMWSSEGLSENDGTHQVITKEAILYVEKHIPNFFLKDGNSYITQLYSDAPDSDETTNKTFEWHYYYYPTKVNVFGGTETAKKKFNDHYQDAIDYYKGQNGDR